MIRADGSFTIGSRTYFHPRLVEHAGTIVRFADIDDRNGRIHVYTALDNGRGKAPRVGTFICYAEERKET